MKIKRQQWQEWAAMFADKEVNDFSANVKLTLDQAIILRAKIESAALYGMELAAMLSEKGSDLSEAKDNKATLY